MKTVHFPGEPQPHAGGMSLSFRMDASMTLSGARKIRPFQFFVDHPAKPSKYLGQSGHCGHLFSLSLSPPFFLVGFTHNRRFLSTYIARRTKYQLQNSSKVLLHHRPPAVALSSAAHLLIAKDFPRKFWGPRKLQMGWTRCRPLLHGLDERP